jgi:aminoglycoside phosphotransferase family enzyme
MTIPANHSAQLLAGLHSPAAYPHPVQAVRVVETHISWVFLTGEFAYKVKKPVTLGFLDFSTLDLRRRFCDEELRLNRRFSPDLYLDVVPITGTPDAPRIGGDGKAIEFAAGCGGFDDALLNRKLRANAVTPGH